MPERNPRITIIPPNGVEVPFERRVGGERPRAYVCDSAYPSKLDRRKAKRSPGARTQPRRYDLKI